MGSGRPKNLLKESEFRDFISTKGSIPVYVPSVYQETDAIVSHMNRRYKSDVEYCIVAGNWVAKILATGVKLNSENSYLLQYDVETGKLRYRTSEEEKKDGKKFIEWD